MERTYSLQYAGHDYTVRAHRWDGSWTATVKRRQGPALFMVMGAGTESEAVQSALIWLTQNHS